MLGVSRGGAENRFSLMWLTGFSWCRSLLWFHAEARRTAESAENGNCNWLGLRGEIVAPLFRRLTAYGERTSLDRDAYSTALLSVR